MRELCKLESQTLVPSVSTSHVSRGADSPEHNCFDCARSVPVPAPMMEEPAPEETSSDEEAEAPPYYAPKPSAGTWFSWLPEDPILLAGVIISFLSSKC